MKKSPRRLSGFEPLEDRCLPTTFGIPWADPSHLTLSFVSDGAQTPLGASSLYSALVPAGPVQDWQREILRAFQTWAVKANINIGLVSDGGQAVGALGAIQGDSRFGDIRVAAALLSQGIVANTSPFSWTGTTFSGDVMLNSSQPYSIGNQPGSYDIYTVALHEAAHVFGLADQTADLNSATWAWYQGLVSALSAQDINALRTLYGTRTADAFDAAGSNNTRATADTMTRAAGSSQLLATADLTTMTDVDFYKFYVPALLPNLSNVTVRLKASGISLLTASVTILDSSGRVVGSAVCNDPLNNDLMLSFRPGLLGGTYYVRVAGAGNGVFDVGGYKLAVDFLSLGGILAPLTSTVGAVLDGHTNDLIASALNIAPPHTSDNRFDAIYRGVIEDRSDVDTYRIGTTRYEAGSVVSLNVMVWGLEAGGLDPRIRVYNSAGNPVAFQVLANDDGLFSVQVLNAVAGNYYFQIAARNSASDHATGSYFMAAKFHQSSPTVYDGVATGSASSAMVETATLTLEDAGLFQFSLAANSISSGSAITMTVYDEYGNIAFAITAIDGQPNVTTVRYLRAGTYSVRYTSPSATPVTYNLYMLILSDEVGTYATSTANPPPQGGSPPPPPPSSGGSGYNYSGSSTARPSNYGYIF